ncbi:Rha family transcriptional regulator [Yersinia canariae]|uniref:Rha family transcriptional regulator n=1 Tax=Yersinia canariae TaxID=2607663 RepID=UPI001C708F8F|nr:Rha family transcriptional regulator [Yersinia canariae]
MSALTLANGRSDVTKMSSREIATLTSKQHKNVKRDVEVMLEDLKEDKLKFEHIYLDTMNRKQSEYLLDREHVECLLTGYSAQLRMKVIRRLRQIEDGSKKEKSSSGLPEYRRARTLKMSVEAVHQLFDMMPNLSDLSKQCAAANIINPVAGFEAIPLPKLEEHFYTAGQVGEMLGISAQKIGRISNANNLKTDQYGIYVMDKSAYSSKQVEAFRYNANGVEALRHLIHGADVA